MNFDEALEALDAHEGGYLSPEDAARQRDPGGETYRGIARTRNPAWPGWARIDALKHTPGFPESLGADATLQQMVADLYRTDYWQAAHCDLLPDAIRFDTFDMAVNSGVPAAIKLLQRTVCVNADGIVGPQTLTAIRAMPATRFVAHFNAYRLAFLTSLANWPNSGRGWALRIIDNILAGT